MKVPATFIFTFSSTAGKRYYGGFKPNEVYCSSSDSKANYLLSASPLPILIAEMDTSIA